MNYSETLAKFEDNNHIIALISVDEVLRFGYEAGFNENTRILDLCCGYGTMLKVWSQAYGISGVGVDMQKRFVEKGTERIKQAGVEDKIKLVVGDVLAYEDNEKYDVVLCSETFCSTIEETLAIGEKFLKDDGLLVYHKIFSKVPNPPQELIDFEGEVLPLTQLNQVFNGLGYYISYMVSDSDSKWENYIFSDIKKSYDKLKSDPNDEQSRQWIDKWTSMYFEYRRPYQGQGLFGLVKL